MFKRRKGHMEWLTEGQKQSAARERLGMSTLLHFADDTRTREYVLSIDVNRGGMEVMSNSDVRFVAWYHLKDIDDRAKWVSDE